jgi:hypothetical protein
VLYLVCVLVLLLISRFEYQCVGLVPVVQHDDSDAECRPLDIQLYTWSGPGFELGECWHQGHRFSNGATWGRADTPDAPYCVCEQGKVRIFYSQRQQQSLPSHKLETADSLTLLRPTQGSSPTSNDLAKWPIPNVSHSRQRTIICSIQRLGRRIRSRDGCIGCRCSKNGHWLCRRVSSIPKINRTVNNHRQQQQQSSSR